MPIQPTDRTKVAKISVFSSFCGSLFSDKKRACYYMLTLAFCIGVSATASAADASSAASFCKDIGSVAQFTVLAKRKGISKEVIQTMVGNDQSVSLYTRFSYVSDVQDVWSFPDDAEASDVKAYATDSCIKLMKQSPPAS